MGIVSWIKNKYYDSRFQKANRLLSEGDVNESVEIFKEILDKHFDAPSVLLSIYHTEIERGTKAKINEAIQLYRDYPNLKNECISFANSVSRIQKPVIAIEYIQSLFGAGVREVKDLFVNTARQYVLSAVSVSSLTSLTRDRVLMSALAEMLFNDVKQFYNDNNLSRCKQVCELIRPVLTTKEFYKVYSNVRFDTLALGIIDSTSILELDKLFNDVKTQYNLTNTDVKHLTDKGLKLSQKSFNNNDYVASLLVSQRLLGKYPEADKLYADSALKLYQSNNINKKLIVATCLYKALGTKAENLIIGLESFIAYDPLFKQKYLDSALSEIKRLLPTNRDEAERIFFHTWCKSPDKQLIDCVLSYGKEEDRIVVATHILEKDSEILSKETYLTAFVTRLKDLANLDFVSDSVEILLSKGKKVESAYEWVILKLANTSPVNSRKRVEILTRGLQHVQAEVFFDKKSEFLKDYIASGRYDKSYAHAEATSLKGKHGLADVLIAYILLDEAKKSQDNSVAEHKLREALAIRISHSQLFDQSSYDAIILEIASQISQLAENIYGQDKDRAIALLYLLRDNGLAWFEVYASLFLNSITNSEPSPELASTILGIIKEGSDSQILPCLWEKYLSVQISVANKFTQNEAIAYLLSINNELSSKCNTNNKTELLKSANNVLCKLLMSRAKNAEKEEGFDAAISDYENILSLLGNYIDVKARVYICKLKSGHRISDNDRIEINRLLKSKTGRRYQNDLAYRWCIYLISENDLTAAEDINNRILGGDSEITQICQEERIIAQQVFLDNLNEQIIRLNNSELTAQEAISLGQSLNKTLDDISLIVHVTPQKVKILKDAIRVHAIEKFYENGDYLDSLNGLKVHDSTYLSDPIALRNIAIMALSAAENELLSEANYKELLSIWVTAIYQQRLFVDSLDYTSWDDPYTFSLQGALGHLDNQDEDLPDNVNYDDPNDANVVSILEVQKSLLLRMEDAIQDNSEYQTFLSSQLEAMDKLASQDLDERCVIVAPYLLMLSNTYKTNVSHALTMEASQHYGNWEEILEVGCMYGISTDDFGRYSKASANLETAIKAVERKSQISRAFTLPKVTTIKEFPGLTSQLVSTITTALNADIAQNSDYTAVYNSYGGVIKAVGDDTTAFAFSSYINQQIVRKLNDKSITLANGAPILFDIYSYCKCNLHLKRNLENIIEALIHNYITDGDNGNLTALDNLLSSTRDFDQCVVKALKGSDGVPEEMMAILFSSNETRFNTLKSRIGSKSTLIQNQFTATENKMAEVKVQLELSQIVEKVTKESMQKCDALEKLYNIYKHNKSNERVCENLAALIPMCVMEYIVPGKIEQSKVENVLNSLQSNMSSTYHAHSSPVKEAYDVIWNSLSPQNRMALSGSSIYELNEDGRRLKKGLNYLKILS